MQLIATNGATGAPYLTLALEGAIGARGLWVAGGEAVAPRALALPRHAAERARRHRARRLRRSAHRRPRLRRRRRRRRGRPGPRHGWPIGDALRREDTDGNANDFVAGIPTPGAPNKAVDGACDPDACVGLAAGAVLLNEVRYDPPGADGAGEREFVEIYARSGAQTEGVALYLINGSDGRP